MKTVPKSLVFLLVVMLAVGTGACRSAAPSFSESIAAKSQERIRTEKLKDNPDRDWQTFDLLGPSVAVFLLRAAKGVPDPVLEKVESTVVAMLKQGRLFETLQTPGEIRNRLSDNRILDQKRSVYLDSLSTIAISDKDISNPLGRHLEAANFFVFQIDNWPCPECFPKDRIRMKIRLVEAVSGDIVWTGIDEIDYSAEREEEAERLAVLLAEDLMDRFRIRFKRKWHKIRYSNLAALAD